MNQQFIYTFTYCAIAWYVVQYLAAGFWRAHPIWLAFIDSIFIFLGIVWAVLTLQYINSQDAVACSDTAFATATYWIAGFKLVVYAVIVIVLGTSFVGISMNKDMRRSFMKTFPLGSGPK